MRKAKSCVIKPSGSRLLAGAFALVVIIYHAVYPPMIILFSWETIIQRGKSAGISMFVVLRAEDYKDKLQG
ncbi:hypothetical protein BYT27DRAFT_7197513 [Phlegmacium glaucopus]|nr:hypothetical protein BYT27DRAFT_7197513 [Phlegmacium glaucopus]